MVLVIEWAIDRDGRGKKASMRIAELAGCPLEPYDKLLNCVRNMNGEYLTSAYKYYQVRNNFHLQNGRVSETNPVSKSCGEVVSPDIRDYIKNNSTLYRLLRKKIAKTEVLGSAALIQLSK